MDVIRKKKAYKSKVYSVRWDNEKMAFLKSKEKNLETGQEIADYLMNYYWWKNKMPHVTAKEAPPLELENKIDYRPNTPESYDGKKIKNVDDEPKQTIIPDTKLIPMGSAEYFKNKIEKTTTIKEIESVMKEVKSSLLIGKQRQALENIAKEHSKQFYTD